MNRLSVNKRIQAIAALIEGNSIRSTERMVGAHRDTIMRLMLRVGNACHDFMDRELRDLPCDEIQIDEVWGYVGKKEKNLKRGDDLDGKGSIWTFTAICADSKLVPCFRIGKRTLTTADAFVSDLASRVAGRIQLSSDGLSQYVKAVDRAFGSDVDYGQIVKTFQATAPGPGRYSPPKVVRVTRHAMKGSPDPDRISTSYCERLNLSTRMCMRRMTRLTNGFSKKIENHRAATALHFCSYNFVRKHRTLKTTPAVALGVADRVWSVADLVALAN